MTLTKMTSIISSYIKSAEKNAYLEVGFYGGSFTGIEKEQQLDFLKNANEYILKGEIKGIRLSTRPDYIDYEILEYLKKYNVKTIELGVQSLDNEVLKCCNRGHNRDAVFYSSRLIKEFGFELGIQTMIGLPYDSKEKDLSTARSILDLSPQIVRIYPTLVIKGTFLEKLFLNGVYKPLSLDEAVDICSELLDLYEANGINVIRIGLQPTDNISEGMDVLTGPFHPAFRQLVESRSCRNKIENQIIEYNLGKDSVLEILTNKKYFSSVIGQKKENISYLKRKFGYKDINIVVDESVKGKFCIKP